MAPTMTEVSQRATMAPPAYVMTVVLFSTASHLAFKSAMSSSAEVSSEEAFARSSDSLGALEPERRQQVTPRDEDGGRHGGGADGGEAPPAEKRRGVRRGGHAVSSVPYRTRRRFAGGLSASAPPLLCDGILPMSAAQ